MAVNTEVIPYTRHEVANLRISRSKRVELLYRCGRGSGYGIGLDEKSEPERDCRRGIVRANSMDDERMVDVRRPAKRKPLYARSRKARLKKRFASLMTRSSAGTISVSPQWPQLRSRKGFPWVSHLPGTTFTSTLRPLCDMVMQESVRLPKHIYDVGVPD